MNDHAYQQAIENMKNHLPIKFAHIAKEIRELNRRTDDELLTPQEQADLITSLKPNISSRAFWDVDFKKMDYIKHADWIIQRVCLRGKFDDFFELVQFYGRDKMNEAINARIKDISELPHLNEFVIHEDKILKERLKFITDYENEFDRTEWEW